jgi:hypothetical protein
MSKVAGLGHRRPHPSPAAPDAGEGAVQGLSRRCTRSKKVSWGEGAVEAHLNILVGCGCGPVANRPPDSCAGPSCALAETCRCFLDKCLCFWYWGQQPLTLPGVRNRVSLAGGTYICGLWLQSTRFLAALTFLYRHPFRWGRENSKMAAKCPGCALLAVKAKNVLQYHTSAGWEIAQETKGRGNWF